MKRKFILSVGIVMLVMAGCSNSEVKENVDETAWEDIAAVQEAEDTVAEVATEESIGETEECIEALSAILGKWTLDGEKTQEEMEKVGTDLCEEFGTAISQYGAGAELRADGCFSFYEGIGIGGEGTYRYENGLVTVDYEPYVEVVEDMEVVLYPKTTGEQDYLILKLYGQELYLVRE